METNYGAAVPVGELLVASLDLPEQGVEGHQ